MDGRTLDAYDRDACRFADDWHAQPAPTDLHVAVKTFFVKGSSTADVGCGSGRDTAWLDLAGYPATGFDASEGLLNEARWRYPELKFVYAALPALENVASGTFTNVLCETVLMHIQPELIPSSVERLFDILIPGGVLYLSWRVTANADRRDEHGRLYAAFDPELVLTPLDRASIRLNEEVGSVSSGKLIRRIVAQKSI
jgi:SAM-dependent methyltransferase